MTDAAQPPLPREAGQFAEIPQWNEQFMRPVDPVRAAALHEAVAIVSAPEYLPTPPLDDRMGLSHVLEIAERFEAWLAGPDEDGPR
jgi:hypothetical protein